MCFIVSAVSAHSYCHTLTFRFWYWMNEGKDILYVLMIPPGDFHVHPYPEVLQLSNLILSLQKMNRPGHSK